jgi:hypothetical protein
MPATRLGALVIAVVVIGLERNFTTSLDAVYFDRSDQINQNSRGLTALSGVRIKQAIRPSLYDVERSGNVTIRG